MARKFDAFAALDGPCLNGMEGEAGVMRIRFYSDGETLKWDEPLVRYFPGVAGGHAITMNDQGTVAFLGTWMDCGAIFNPRTLEVVNYYNLHNIENRPRDVDHRSPTHMAFPKDGGAWTPGFARRSSITAGFKHFYEVDVDNPRRFRRLAKHRLGLAHALKVSATGKYIFCGAADYKPNQRARRVGIFEPSRTGGLGEMRVKHLQRTSWHIQTHPTKDIMYAVTENYEAGTGPKYQRQGNAISIPPEGNYLWEVFRDDETGDWLTSDYAMSMDRPSNLSSDIVVVENADDSISVLYNSCASGTITMIRLEPRTGPQGQRIHKVYPKYVEEGVWMFKGPHKAILRPSVLRAFRRNLQEARWRGELFSKDGKLRRRVEFVTRKTLVDGSYGLMLSPDKRWLISAHRGGNWFLVYKYPEVLSQGADALAYRIKLPPAQKCLPGHSCGFMGGAFKDFRLGTHHCVLSETTVE